MNIKDALSLLPEDSLRGILERLQELASNEGVELDVVDAELLLDGKQLHSLGSLSKGSLVEVIVLILQILLQRWINR